MKTIKITNESTTFQVGNVVMTAYVQNGETVINICPEKPMLIEPVSARMITIKIKD